MNLPVILAAGDNPLKAVGETFGWHPQLFISQVVLFVLLAIILKKFAYAPLLAMLEKRKSQIAESIENAEKTRKELANAQAKSQELIGFTAAARDAAEPEARTAAARVSEIERQKAIADAANIIEKAKQSNDAELARMKAELRQEFGRLVVAAAGRATGEILSPDQKGRLADDAVRQLAA